MILSQINYAIIVFFMEMYIQINIFILFKNVLIKLK